jgi:ribulose-5-phosphate 4-epimerase/fuculose-1-phosphate aldolase
MTSPSPSTLLEGMDPPDSQEQRLHDLVVANHILGDQGVNDAFGHVSVRSLNNSDHYFMARSKAPELVTADDILEFDADSAPVSNRGRIMYEERFIHGEIYRARPDVACVVHSHTAAVLPFGLAGTPMRPLMHMAAFIPDPVPLFEIRDIEGPDNCILVTNTRSGAALAQTLGQGSAVLMRGHGCTIVGPNIRHAVYRAIYFKKSAELQLASTALSPELNGLSGQEQANFGARLATMGSAGPFRPWPIWVASAEARHRDLLDQIAQIAK